MSRELVQTADNWKQIHKAFNMINFTSYDYNTVKQSLIDYLKLYHPEYNNYIESDELIAIIECFSYVCELLAYRIDMVGHENVISIAQRKDSVLRLAKYISYKASRNIAGRGLVKLTAVSTTEHMTDAAGNDLANAIIRWGDAASPNWKNRFLRVINAALSNDIGTVGANERHQIYDQVFELYHFDNVPLVTGTIAYTASSPASASPVAMELVPAALDDTGPYERRPERNSKFSLLYSTDGLGDTSNYTGFFMMTKQGTLKRRQVSFDGVSRNQTYDIAENNINDADVWLNNVDAITGNIVGTAGRGARVGEWDEVDIAFAHNVMFNALATRNKYEIETLQNDSIRLLFGDGEFASIPAGVFDIWYRISSPDAPDIQTASVSNIQSNLLYLDASGNKQTISFTFSLVEPIANASPSEDIEHIRRIAPSMYYTQDRMVNGVDYNTYLLRDPSIIKLKARNHASAGDSIHEKITAARDGLRIHGNDLAIFYDTQTASVSNIHNNITSDILVDAYVEPLLSNVGQFTYRSHRSNSQNTRRYFTTAEKSNIINNYLNDGAIYPVFLVLNDNVWVPHTNSQLAWDIKIVKVVSSTNTQFSVDYYTTNIAVHSDTTSFAFSGNYTINTLVYNDYISILGANVIASGNGILAHDINLIVSDRRRNYSLPVYSRIIPTELTTIPFDANNDGMPDDVLLTSITKYSHLHTSPGEIACNFYFLPGDVTVIGDVDDTTTVQINGIASKYTITSLGNNSSVVITIQRYAYFDISGGTPVCVNDSSAAIVGAYASGDVRYARYHGRSSLNFTWVYRPDHRTQIDASPSNLIHMDIITQGHYNSVARWLSGLITTPIIPSPRDLRSSYTVLTQNKMLSDEVVFSAGKFKVLFGRKAEPQLRAQFRVVKKTNSSATDSQIKQLIVSAIRDFFAFTDWDFGDSFNFSEMNAKIHILVPDVASFTIHPLTQGATLQIINCDDNEILIPDIDVNDIDIVNYV